MNDQPLRPCATPHSAPVAWLNADPEPIAKAWPPILIDQEPLRSAIELVLASPEAVAEIIKHASPANFVDHTPVGRTRHDGWNGERMASFLEILASTGLISEACRSVGMSRDAAYALRDRDPVFAAALRAAQAKARSLVADGMLERSITGTVEHYYRNGALVGERRHYESWLALAVLKRLDNQAEDDRSERALATQIEDNWYEVIETLRSRGTSKVHSLLEAKAYEADIPPLPGIDEPEKNVWQTESGVWMTVFPPPPDFDGDENCPFDGFNYYERTCTAEEIELIEASDEAAAAQELAELIAEDEAKRDSFFADLQDVISASTSPQE